MLRSRTRADQRGSAVKAFTAHAGANADKQQARSQEDAQKPTALVSSSAGDAIKCGAQENLSLHKLGMK